MDTSFGMRIIHITLVNVLIILGIGYFFYGSRLKEPYHIPKESNISLSIRRDGLKEDQQQNSVRRCTQKERLQFIQKQCKHVNYWTDPEKQQYTVSPTPFIVNREKQVAYCYIPKNGCSGWKKVLTSTTKYGKEHGSAKHDVHQSSVLTQWGLRKATFSWLLKYYSNHTRFMVVRHPFDRLVSAYVDKMVAKRDNYYSNVRKEIIKKFRTGEVTDEDINEGTPTFLEFVKMLLSHHKNSNDRHWFPYGQNCNPCYLQYHHIIRVESMGPDSVPVLKTLGIDNPEELDMYRHIHTEESVEHRNQKSTLKLTKVQPKYLKEFANIPKDLLQQLTEKYQDDLTLFGYHFDSESLKASCGIETESGDVCC